MSGSAGGRVAIQQPGLPWYRVGLFDRLGAALGADLNVFYDTARPNATRADVPDGRFQPRAVRDRHLFGGRVIWSPTQIRLAASSEWDWIVLSWNSRYLSLPVALLIARVRGNRLALWGHGFSPGQSEVRRRYRGLLARCASRVLLYSERGLDELPEGVRRRSVVVGNTQFRTAVDGRRERSSRSGRDPRQLSIVHVGQLRADRGLDLALEALAELIRRDWDARLTVVGDGPARAELERRSRQLGLANRVQFTGAIHGDDAIRELYDLADVATFGAAGGLGVVDALDHAVPVVLWGEQSHQPPEADLVYELFPDLVDVAATNSGVADRFERAVTERTVRERAEAAALHVRRERALIVARFTEALPGNDQAERGVGGRRR